MTDRSPEPEALGQLIQSNVTIPKQNDRQRGKADKTGVQTDHRSTELNAAVPLP
ncbi:hypothetical protein [Novosphingobium sp. Chol11]|uniref:hypothetical protein n=1 Tax=Novosphingobium sp. Chol11 TaxID=1385763 RepID=UPI0025F684CF|nr:hypothetical protein [Novosphingobium sp. Chol11]